MIVQLDRLLACMEWLEKNAEKYEQMQSIDSLIADMGVLVRSLAFCNGQMVSTKRLLLDARARAYQQLTQPGATNPIILSPMLAKDYVNSIVAEEQMQYDIAERCSRTVSRTIEALQTCISALKTELQVTSYGSRMNAIA